MIDHPTLYIYYIRESERDTEKIREKFGNAIELDPSVKRMDATWIT
jgi:hypothetical protein